MFNRRFLRIKVFHELYAYWQDEKANRTLHEKSLLKSLEKAYQIYVYMLALPGAFRFFIEKELDIQQSKYFPQESIIMPLLAFHQNKLILQLDESKLLQSKVKHHKLIWDQTTETFKQVWQLFKDNAAFVAYAQKTSPSFADDKKMLNEFYQVCIAESDLFNHYIEEKFLNWEDDQVLVTTALLKSIDQMQAQKVDEGILNDTVSADEEDKFMQQLFVKCIESDDEFTKLVAEKTSNWEPERIALVDMLLMKMALCEILKFPQIPIKVSINEYLEVAKLYSTPNSHGFINGILDKIQLDLRRQNKINKTGRGLVE
jgi:N utilization substance protein B